MGYQAKASQSQVPFSHLSQHLAKQHRSPLSLRWQPVSDIPKSDTVPSILSFPPPTVAKKAPAASPCSSEKVSPSAWMLGSPLLSPCTPIHKRAETQAARHPIGPTSAKNRPLDASAECRCAGQVAGRAKAVKLVGGEQASAATQRSQSVQEQEPPETMERETTSAQVHFTRFRRYSCILEVNSISPAALVQCLFFPFRPLPHRFPIPRPGILFFRCITSFLSNFDPPSLCDRRIYQQTPDCQQLCVRAESTSSRLAQHPASFRFSPLAPLPPYSLHCADEEDRNKKKRRGRTSQDAPRLSNARYPGHTPPMRTQPSAHSSVDSLSRSCVSAAFLHPLHLHRASPDSASQRTGDSTHYPHHRLHD
ncbi:uncharacterized protein CLUP02_08592 [Colletotrichum lupini]|uniref:Uncharacterized protein n=1 Tax=Colletotrichum lupini TaxID=145971 RepID=A0A9Q8ST36_9PEZI|nr:uncharacterized protein CLUP02_08592 [Colletotrichum lupini]UQC83099.1 hypothetical protein CLUP02_08592 [Colletotrichum lupini]